MNEKKQDPQSTKKVLKCIGNKHDKTQDEKNAQNHYKNKQQA